MAYNKTKVVSEIAQKTNLSKAQAEAAVNAFEEVLIESLENGEGMRLTGVLTAQRVERAARKGRNPRTSEIIDIPASYGVKLTPGSLLKKAVTDEASAKK